MPRVLEQKVPIPEAARRLRRSGQTLKHGVGRARRGPRATRGERRRPVTEREAELFRLKRDLAEARRERALLQKAPAYVAKAQRPGTRS